MLEGVFLVEWHVDPFAALGSWTPDQLDLLLDARNKRIEREKREAKRGKSGLNL